mmetsp:Transcript_20432/g.62269  ORF Transcript_20432/g.62269 Transcript_20432/m.62269 type:complete len:111 (-) Transcript_20432:518-850(-)|eukprot:scaffold231789_cov33-Tisochrysis_lutea.AAC.2
MFKGLTGSHMVSAPEALGTSFSAYHGQPVLLRATIHYGRGSECAIGREGAHGPPPNSLAQNHTMPNGGGVRGGGLVVGEEVGKVLVELREPLLDVGNLLRCALRLTLLDA